MNNVNSYSNINDDDLQQEDRIDLPPQVQEPTTYDDFNQDANQVNFGPSIDVEPGAPNQGRGQTYPVMTPISPTISERGRAKTMPDNLSRFRKAATKAVAARRFSCGF